MSSPQFHPHGDAGARFERYFPKGRDVTLIILKGHLLVEEQLNGLISIAFVRPNFLSQARLSFTQRICIAKAAHSCVDGRTVKALERLNVLRNMLAHQLEPADLSGAIGAFLVALWPDRQPDAPHSLTELKQSIAVLAGTLAGMQRGITEVSGVGHAT